MKSTKKVLITSFATIALSAALIGGSTFALFTSEKNTNITVTSGSVEIKAELNESNVKTYSTGTNINDSAERTDGKWDNGGSVAINASAGTLTATNMTPGDVVEFDIEVTNVGSIAVKYSVKIGDYTVKEVSVGDEEGETVDTTNWDELFTVTAKVAGQPITWADLAVEGTATVRVAVALSEDAGKEVMNKVITLAVTVQAVQSNANTGNLPEGAFDD